MAPPKVDTNDKADTDDKVDTDDKADTDDTSEDLFVCTSIQLDRAKTPKLQPPTTGYGASTCL